MSVIPRLANGDDSASTEIASMPVVLCFLNCASKNYISEKETIDQLSEEFSGVVRFAVIDPWELISAAEYFDVNSFPALVLIDGLNSNRGFYWGEFAKEEIREHLEKWLAECRKNSPESCG